MPHRLEHPVAFVFAMLGVFTSFVASLAHSASVTAQQTLLAAVDDTTLLSWAGTSVAVLAVVSPGVIRIYKSFRETRLAQDTAEMDVWSGRIASEVVKRSEFEAEAKILKQQLVEAKAAADAEIAALKAQNAMQAAQLEAITSKLGRVASATADNRDKVKDQAQRIETLERTTGSSDNISAT